MGSGFGEGAHLDALPVKSASGLPYIPGRTVKGLFGKRFYWLKNAARFHASQRSASSAAAMTSFPATNQHQAL